MTERIPDTLSTLTTIKRRPDGTDPRWRRPRANRPGVRANTVPPVLPGEKVFRIVPDAATLRRWGRKHGFKIRDKGRVPKGVREAFMAYNNNGAWTVRVISAYTHAPGSGKRVAISFYQVRQGSYIHEKETTDPFYVRRMLGDELFPLLTLVEPDGQGNP